MSNRWKGGFIQLYFDPLTDGAILYELYSWGLNGQGQLGLSDLANRSSPVQVGALKNWAQISAGNGFSVAIKTDGTLWSWGQNGSGKLGQNIANTIVISSPVQVGALTNWSKISASSYHCLAIKTDGTLWSWGYNNRGQLGQNIAYSINRSSPVQVGALTDWAQVDANTLFSLAIKTDGTLWSWGYNGQGQLGQNIVASTNRSSPVQVGALTDWLQIGGGENWSLAVKTNNTLWAWGYNGQGQLGLNSITARSSPVQVGVLTNWLQATGGQRHSLAVKTNNTLWSWGYNNVGQLGQNLITTTNRSSPVQVGALTDWAQVEAGYRGGLAIKTNGTLWSWGLNNVGQLGVNDTANRSSPIQVGALTSWLKASSGKDLSLAITEIPPA